MINIYVYIQKLNLFLNLCADVNWLYKIKLSFHHYKLSISFSETKRSHADEHIQLPSHTDRFPHRGMDYQILVTQNNVSIY